MKKELKEKQPEEFVFVGGHRYQLIKEEQEENVTIPDMDISKFVDKYKKMQITYLRLEMGSMTWDVRLELGVNYGDYTYDATEYCPIHFSGEDRKLFQDAFDGPYLYDTILEREEVKKEDEKVNALIGEIREAVYAHCGKHDPNGVMDWDYEAEDVLHNIFDV